MSRSVLSIIGVLILALVVTACGDTPPPSSSGEPSEAPESQAAESPGEESQAPAPTPTEGRLALIQDRGQLICGVNDGLPGFGFVDENGENTGFDVDFCRAIAAAVFGDPEAVEFRPVSADGRPTALQSGEVDVLIRNTTWTVTRDTTWGLFAPTTFYDGQGMMVRADAGIETLADLSGATICVQTGTTTELNLADVFAAQGIDFTPLPFGDDTQTYQAYDDGQCDAVTSDRSQLLAQRTALSTPDDHVILNEVMSKEPLGPVVPLGDDAWFNIVKWVVFATFEAEEQGITQDNVADMASTSENPVVQRLLGAANPELGEGLGLEPDWVVNVISAVGNYGEIYDRHLGPGTPFELERGPNALWTDGGLLYAPPYR
ncbi:MAG TPA: amino acid ABC transporter substrate-binding protein [Candidatus Limnocylindria bacterium]|nr:amino acid ABC transporter substrate-binding protein [Candidatus Limnocylindria bacterium]